MDWSRITENLFIGTTPDVADYDTLRGLGVRLVINMRGLHRSPRDRHNPSIPVLWLRTFDLPFLPIPLRKLRRGVKAALDTIAAGGKVYVHCAAGVHRSVAMAAAILIAQGYTAKSAMRLIKARRPLADPYKWYIRRRIERFAATWEQKK
jgi:protein-tyrosine phosphatase